jgi:hypothetical protein
MAMTINPAFCGHGIFTEYSIHNALTRFAGYGGGAPATTPDEQISRFVQAMKDMEIASVWIQLFTRPQKIDADAASADLRKKLIAALAAAGVRWAGWGYCAGVNWVRDKGWIKSFRDDLGMQAFVIDAEPEEANNKDVWTEANFKNFVTYVSGLFGSDNLALSTWPALQLREASVTTLIKIAEPLICLIAPQVYWNTYPTTVHYNTLGYSKTEFPPNDPVSFVRMMLRAWKDAGITTPLVMSGQAYWGESANTPQSVMTPKVAQFANNFQDWDKIIGFNWYHAGGANTGGTGSMSDQMIADIKSAHLGGKSYKVP